MDLPACISSYGYWVTKIMAGCAVV